MITRVWKDPVWSKIIATGILAVIVAVSSYFLNWWPIIKNAVGSFLTFLVSSTETWNWLLGLMALCSISVLCVVVVTLWQLFFPSKSVFNWKSYTEDSFFGLQWHWRYGSDGSIYNLYSCCPNCLYQVLPEDASSYNSVPKIGFKCDSCGTSVGPIDETKYTLESKVKRFIQQKLRTGDWALNDKVA